MKASSDSWSEGRYDSASSRCNSATSSRVSGRKRILDGNAIVDHKCEDAMNEYIEVEFRKPGGQRLRVKRQVTGGIEFEEPDPIERTVGLQLNGRSAATELRMRRIAQVKGWELGQFKLTISVEDGNIVLRG